MIGKAETRTVKLKKRKKKKEGRKEKKKGSDPAHTSET